MKRYFCLIHLVFLIIIASCKPAVEPEPDHPMNILFIGNSYTFMNDLPGIFSDLSELAGHQANVVMFAKPGYSLLDHTQDPELQLEINNQNWDIVIIQEKSDRPILNRDSMLQGVQQIDEMLASQDQRVILFMPWAYEAGFPDAELDNYVDMQNKVAEAYYMTAEELDVEVAPVGIAWQSALQEKPDLELWAEDGRHPTRLGSFLAANVFYALVFDQNPAGIQILNDDEHQEQLHKFLQLTAVNAVSELQR